MPRHLRGKNTIHNRKANEFSDNCTLQPHSLPVRADCQIRGFHLTYPSKFQPCCAHFARVAMCAPGGPIAFGRKLLQPLARRAKLVVQHVPVHRNAQELSRIQRGYAASAGLSEVMPPQQAGTGSACVCASEHSWVRLPPADAHRVCVRKVRQHTAAHEQNDAPNKMQYLPADDAREVGHLQREARRRQPPRADV